MPPKRNVKMAQKTKVPPKVTRTTKVVVAKKQEVKKKGRPAKLKTVVKPKKAKSISLEDIVKDKKVSTCDECGGVWFSKVLFNKHLLSCGVQNSVQIVSNKRDTAATLDTPARGKRRNQEDDSEMEESPVQAQVNGRSNNARIPPVKKSRKIEEAIKVDDEDDDVEITNSIPKCEDKAVLQTFMSNKVQSLLFASKSPEKELLPEEQSPEINLDNGVSLIASNLRKNIASSMLKSTPAVAYTSRPTRSSGPLNQVESVKPAGAITNKAGQSNQIIASVEVHSVQPPTGGRAKGNCNPPEKDEETKVPLAVLSQLAPLRAGRGRKSQQKAKPATESPADTITVLQTSPNVDAAVVEKASPRRGRGRKPQQEQSSIASNATSNLETPNEIAEKVPQKRGRGRKTQPKENESGDTVESLPKYLDVQSTPHCLGETDSKRVVASKTGRGRKPQQKDKDDGFEIIVPTSIHADNSEGTGEKVTPLKSGRGRKAHQKEKDTLPSNVNTTREAINDASESEDVSKVQLKENSYSEVLSNNITNSEVPNTQEDVIFDCNSQNLVLSGTPVILTPLQPIKEEDDEPEEKSALHSSIFNSEVSNDVPGSSASLGDAKIDPNAIAFTCAVCQKSFTRKYHLDRHLRISRCSGLPLPSFPCELCNRVYTRKDNLREHLRSHTGEVHRRKNHKCQFCDKAFHGQSLLAIHVRKHTGEKPFPCDFCPKRFPSTGALSKHRMTHTGEKPYTCNECGRRFTLKGTLSRHLRTHTGIRPHTCTFCGKKFIQIGGLNAHMFYHTGENGFKCEDCGKVFNRKARLQMHQLYVHIKLKPFVCEHCSKPFTRKEDLMRHAVLHTGEKPFKCPTCDRRFSVKPSLKLHLLTHTKEEPRSCHECGRAFIRKDCLLRHMRKRHRDVFDKLFFDEKDEKDSSIVNTRVLSEKDLTENIRELLYLLIDEPTLVGFGWPDKPVDEVLELVIQRCGHTPVSKDLYTYMDRLRENAKLLFTVVIDDNAVKTLLNNQTVDEVILHVLRLAKT